MVAGDYRWKKIFRDVPNWLYLIPVFAFVGFFIYYGIGYTVYISLFEWNGISPDKTFIGIQHYLQLFRDSIFYLSVGHTFIFMVITIFTQMILGLLIALMLKSQVRLKAVYKVIFFLPTVMSQAVIAALFRQIFNAHDGELNRFLEAVGFDFLALSWLADPDIALYSIAVINIWEFTGFSFIMYFAALSVLDREVYEAAYIEGAGFFKTFIKITFPMLKSTHYSLIMLGVIGSLKTFDLVFLTTGGGPGRASELLSTYIYKKMIVEYNAGYASALCVIFLLLTLILTAIQLRAYKER